MGSCERGGGVAGLRPPISMSSTLGRAAIADKHVMLENVAGI